MKCERREQKTTRGVRKNVQIFYATRRRRQNCHPQAPSPPNPTSRIVAGSGVATPEPGGAGTGTGVGVVVGGGVGTGTGVGVVVPSFVPGPRPRTHHPPEGTDTDVLPSELLFGSVNEMLSVLTPLAFGALWLTLRRLALEGIVVPVVGVALASPPPAICRESAELRSLGGVPPAR